MIKPDDPQWVTFGGVRLVAVKDDRTSCGRCCLYNKDTPYCCGALNKWPAVREIAAFGETCTVGGHHYEVAQ